jgi:hypothetical protein
VNGTLYAFAMPALRDAVGGDGVAERMERENGVRPEFLSGQREAERLSEWAGRRPEPGLLLLADLRRLHRNAAGVSVDWELLAQGAQAHGTPNCSTWRSVVTRRRCGSCGGPTACSKCFPRKS